MKKSMPWHHTRAGSLALWLGSIELAVPVLVVTALALGLGTYLDSSRSTKIAKEVVYGSWWFIALMGLVCISLIFAVVSRFPWKRRHIGFMTVHAGLITLIVGGFWSMFGRVEGHLALEAGTSGSVIETQDEQVELSEHRDGKFVPLAIVDAPQRPTALSLAGISLHVVERWENSRDDESVTNDSPEAFRAIQVQTGSQPIWVGQEDKAGGASVIGGLRIRVLPDGAAWTPPGASPAAASTFAFIVGERHIPLGEVGQDAIPGWKIVSIERFTRALVGGTGLTEAPTGPENPAVDVTITDGRGTTERHTAFLNFADMVMSRTIEGSAHSGARLAPVAPGAEPETLVVYGPDSAPQFGYVSPDGTARVLPAETGFPRTLDLGSRRVVISQQFDRARGSVRTVKAPPAKDNRPALMLRLADSTELAVVPFKGTLPLNIDGRNLFVRFGPRQVPLPFEVRLGEFRKTDYPGTDMAMAYESYVGITRPGHDETGYLIYMNHPYAYGPWRVYQSGFLGENVSVFSIMRDPGLILTYIGCTVLCLGIVITFYSRSLSWGHPGIPVAFANKEQPHASATPPVPVGDPHALRGPVSAGV